MIIICDVIGAKILLAEVNIIRPVFLSDRSSLYNPPVFAQTFHQKVIGLLSPQHFSYQVMAACGLTAIDMAKDLPMLRGELKKQAETQTF